MGPKGEVNLAHPQLRWRLKKFPHPTGRIGGCLLVVFQPVTKYFPAGLELRVVEIDRNPEYRDADEPHGGGRNQQHSGLAEWRVENATALKCRMATTFTPRRGGHRCDKCLTDEVFEFLLGGTEHTTGISGLRSWRRTQQTPRQDHCKADQARSEIDR